MTADMPGRRGGAVTYLEEAERVLRTAEAVCERMADSAAANEQRLRIAEGFARLAAIERGLLPWPAGNAGV